MKRYSSIEILRFLTSVSVLLYHYRHFFLPYNIFSENNYESSKYNLPFYNFFDWLYTYGFYGVHVFYTISGFVFAYVYLSSTKKTTFQEFSINRIARLYPLHFATLLFVALMQLIYLSNYGVSQFGFINDFYHFVLQVLFISSWGFENGHSFNFPIWSVSVEMAIYILFFILLGYMQKYRIPFVIILIIILTLIPKLEIYNSLFTECARLFFSGVLVFYIYERFYLKKFILISISLFLFAASLYGNFKTYIFCPSILLICLNFEITIKQDKLKKIFNKLGNMTYSLYLLHVPTQLVITLIFNKVFEYPNIFYNNYFFICYFIFLFILATLTFNLYEKPMNNRIRKIFIKKLEKNS